MQHTLLKLVKLACACWLAGYNSMQTCSNKSRSLLLCGVGLGATAVLRNSLGTWQAHYSCLREVRVLEAPKPCCHTLVDIRPSVATWYVAKYWSSFAARETCKSYCFACTIRVPCSMLPIRLENSITSPKVRDLPPGAGNYVQLCPRVKCLKPSLSHAKSQQIVVQRLVYMVLKLDGDCVGTANPKARGGGGALALQPVSDQSGRRGHGRRQGP